MKISVVSVSNLILNVFENHSCKLVRCPLRAALALKTGGVSKISDFPASSVNISKTVADTAKVTISD